MMMMENEKIGRRKNNIIDILRDVQLNGPTAVKLSTVTFFDNTLDIQCTPHIHFEIHFKNQGKKSVLLPLKSSSDSEVSHSGDDDGKFYLIILIFLLMKYT